MVEIGAFPHLYEVLSFSVPEEESSIAHQLSRRRERKGKGPIRGRLIEPAAGCLGMSGEV